LGLLAFPVPFFLFITTTVPASRYLVPIVPFLALFAGTAVAALVSRNRVAGVAVLIAATILPFTDSLRADLFIRQADTRTIAAEFIRSHVPAGATILTQPYSVPLEPTAAVLREAVARSGREMPTKTRLQVERTPYPAPAYRVIYLGYGLDADKLYLPYERLTGPDSLAPIRAENVTFVVLKRYNQSDPGTLLSALTRQGRPIAVFSPLRQSRLINADAATLPEPFLHNTDVEIDPSLERPGPFLEIWQLNGSGS
jgi:hypothetical protein